MSNSKNIQPGHYRTYKESGKTIEVNGGPKSKNFSLDFGDGLLGQVIVWVITSVTIITMFTIIFGMFYMWFR
jgi:hypothetical protein